MPQPKLNPTVYFPPRKPGPSIPVKGAEIKV
jgi:hypothetical protein